MNRLDSAQRAFNAYLTTGNERYLVHSWLHLIIMFETFSYA